MDRKKTFFAVLAITFFVAAIFGTKLLIIDRQPPTEGALRIDSFPKATVFLGDKSVGDTPYFDDKLTPKEYDIKLVPAGDNGGSYLTWGGKVKVTESALTYVSRDLAVNDDLSAGQVLTLEKLASENSAELAVVSNPDGAGITVDGLDSGKTPSIIHDISVGDHEVIVSADGYSDQVVRGKIIGGYRLDAVVKLARLPASGQTATVSAVPISTADLISSSSGQTTPQKPYVLILTTPTGFLRVRTDADINATEAARVNPGEKYPLISEVTGWVQIKLPTLSGWVSDQYIERFK